MSNESTKEEKEVVIPEEITEADTIVLNYLEFLFESINKEAILAIYKGTIFHVASEMSGKNTDYKTLARMASSIVIDLLLELESKNIGMEDNGYDF